MTDEMVKLFEELVNHMPEVEVVTIQESTEYVLDEMTYRMKYALMTLQANKAIKHKYDYTWLMLAINEGKIPGISAFKSAQSFIDYLKGLGLKSLPGKTTLHKGNCIKEGGKFPDWRFSDTKDPSEIKRRHDVVRQFISALNKAPKRET